MFTFDRSKPVISKIRVVLTDDLSVFLSLNDFLPPFFRSNKIRLKPMKRYALKIMSIFRKKKFTKKFTLILLV